MNEAAGATWTGATSRERGCIPFRASHEIDINGSFPNLKHRVMKMGSRFDQQAEFIDAIRQVATQLGRTPTRAEMKAKANVCGMNP